MLPASELRAWRMLGWQHYPTLVRSLRQGSAHSGTLQQQHWGTMGTYPFAQATLAARHPRPQTCPHYPVYIEFPGFPSTAGRTLPAPEEPTGAATPRTGRRGTGRVTGQDNDAHRSLLWYFLPGSRRGTPMRVMHSDLAILSAAQYEDGRHNSRARAGGSQKHLHSSDHHLDTKKRPRTVSDPEKDEPEEEKKRARGRPRLNPTDATPQERRRTQIRLAQRAYRNRKESAISDLEKKVDGLKEVNDQMSQAYRDLFDFATRNGLLEKAPEFGERLATLEALAKQSGETLIKSDGDSSDGTSQGSKLVKRKSSGASPPDIALPSPAQQQQPPSQQLWAGVMVSHEPAVETNNHFHHPISNVAPAHPGVHAGYEIIAQPTPQNASFAPNMTFSQAHLFMPWTSVPSPFNSLPNPRTYASQELTFGRRLQRTALQCAASLISMEHPPPDRMMRVFGFARLFETYEQIKERTLACAGVTAQESLYNPKYPFQSLGGNGTHFSHMGPTDLRTASMDSSSSHGGHMSPRSGRPKDSAPFSIGPFDLRTNKIRDSLVGLGGQINLPGFDGVFWDADEVEFYLLHNGVNIPPLVDHCVVEMDEGTFAAPPPPPPPPNNHQSGMQAPMSSNSGTAYTAAANVGLDSIPRTLRTSSTVVTSTSNSSPGSQGDNVTVTSSAPEESWTSQHHCSPDFLPQGYTTVRGTPGVSAFDSSVTGALSDPSLLAYAASDQQQQQHQQQQQQQQHFLQPPVSQFQGLPQAQSYVPRKRAWRIDVEKFIAELISKATCLGRTPGFRPKDVDLAFWASVVDANAI
ncbi:hypothetical protein JX266_005287 [Neoarthrinium moseri]|uniref:uncharacterized protein n=1 Tax=Neoarthrinium moseri TaxID=1658444 RepID=UPI001FDDC3C8|nr:uncharacterized protein JN550_007363 [Neoarthrinium moseri]KAI1848859.1 hypothetical protein JX266_005287 [Neoarthrinium moseri]KAI1866816.1 hypothetical protein JN550_007363 [Neoarthrinium moseri]